MSPGAGNPCHDEKGKFCSTGGSPNVSRGARDKSARRSKSATLGAEQARYEALKADALRGASRGYKLPGWKEDELREQARDPEAYQRKLDVFAAERREAVAAAQRQDAARAAVPPLRAREFAEAKAEIWNAADKEYAAAFAEYGVSRWPQDYTHRIDARGVSALESNAREGLARFGERLPMPLTVFDAYNPFFQKTSGYTSSKVLTPKEWDKLQARKPALQKKIAAIRDKHQRRMDALAERLGG